MTQLYAPLIAPGMIWGNYPERAESREDVSAWQRWWRAAERRSNRLRSIASLARDAQQQAEATQPLHDPTLRELQQQRQAQAIEQIRMNLLRSGLSPSNCVAALALVAGQIESSLGLRLHHNQYVCALRLLNQDLAEMATGEGKTLAAAAAAAVAALARTPVHVLTTNDYLAQRDADELAPLFNALGLTVDAALEQHDAARRRQSYRADIVYAMAKTVAFDYLRDRLVRQQSPGAISHDEHANFALAVADDSHDRLMLRGLCFAIVDEADSILLDEAKTPLIIADAHNDPNERGRLWQALDLARTLIAERDFRSNGTERRIQLTTTGKQQLAALASKYGGAWHNSMHRDEMVTQALTALHLLAKDVDYIVRDQEVEIVDPTTGRVAKGRQWTMGLHALVALKERLPLPLSSRTLASLTYPRLFARYHHLCGLSGTLAEDRAELLATYGLRVRRVERHQPLRRLVQAMRCYRDRATQFAAALARTQALLARGRAVLIATDSVEDSALLGLLFEQAQVPAAILNASQSDAEAKIVAAAGQMGTVTIATQMAGRGTDIKLVDSVARCGGLHVINLQLNRTARLDRQIEGRSARQGDLGSSEHWLRLSDNALASQTTSPLIQTMIKLASVLHAPRGDQAASQSSWRAQLAGCVILRSYQTYCRVEDASNRAKLLRNDQHWAKRLHFAMISE